MQKFSKNITPFMPLPPSDFISSNSRRENSQFFKNCEFFCSGRAALMRALTQTNPDCVWLPEYFCPFLKTLVSKSYKIQIYNDIPSERAPDFASLRPTPKDAVIAVNFFGLSSESLWRKWKSEHQDIILIEDHSHAPFSDWAQYSKADFVFASLRKTLPLPDGGYLRYCGRDAQKRISKIFTSYGGISEFASDSLAAAALSFSDEATAETLYYAGEVKLNSAPSMLRMSVYSSSILTNLDIPRMLDARFETIKTFHRELMSTFDDIFIEKTFELGLSSLKSSQVYYPFLKFKDNQSRDKYYNLLRSNSVFAAIYWGSLGEVSDKARFEQRTTFVIPLDFRHTKEDAYKLVQILKSGL